MEFSLLMTSWVFKQGSKTEALEQLGKSTELLVSPDLAFGEYMMETDRFMYAEPHFWSIAMFLLVAKNLETERALS